jgi:fumarate hydratase subunit alpha
MRTLTASEVMRAVRDLAISVNRNLPDDVLRALRRAREAEESPVGRSVLDKLIENAEIARSEQAPICQDTGLAVLFVELGQEVQVEGGLNAAIHEGVRQGYSKGFLRKSAADPISRQNTGDNTPAVIHYDLAPGDKIRIAFMAKGGGAENMSALHLLKPAQGLEGVKRVVVETVSQAGANPCPPIVVGVGLGGTFELAAINAKKALLRPLGSANLDPDLVGLEKELLEQVNNLGIGPAGFGGRTTALGVHVLKAACHIASLPVAVNLQCHANRHGETVI